MNDKETAAGTPEGPDSRARTEKAPETERAADTSPAEVVEYYEQSALYEVVEYYVQPGPLPRRPSAGAPRTVKKKCRRKEIGLFLLCAAVLAGLATGAFFLGRNSEEQQSGSQENTQQEEKSDTAKVSIPRYRADKNVRFTAVESHGSALTAQEIYQKVNPAVVTVMVQLDGSAAVGTGVIFTSDGYILTNYHVVAGGRDCNVTLSNNGTYTAEYVAGDSSNDVAILKINRKNLSTAEIGSSDALSVGDTVYAIGNPLGVELRGTFTDGIVSAINRDVEVGGRNMTLVQTNAALNAGNSGGPLINVYGQVVGINTIKMRSAFSNVEGLGFALPTSSLQYLVSDLLTYGKIQPEPKLGISVEKLGTTLQDGTIGAKIVAVEPKSPAAKAGVWNGDILVSVDGESVHSSDDVLRIRHRYHVGDRMRLRVWRGTGYLTLTLHLTQAAKN